MVGVKKLDEPNPLEWVTQMELYLSIHGIMNDLHKLQVKALYLDNKHWKWCQWYKKDHKLCIA